MSGPRVAVVQFPGVNCEDETCRALAGAGLDPEVFRWTRPARELGAFDAFVLPGGFAHQDRVRAGAIAAKDPLLDALAGQAAAGRPLLGICNGAQVLIEAGLVPGGGGVELGLARNRMTARTGYFAAWVLCRVEDSPCVFTRHLEPGTLLPLPVAHAEGRFASEGGTRVAELGALGQVPLRYAHADGTPAADFPDNPNGSEYAAAAVCNAEGNVLAMMTHPERALELGSMARGVGGAWGARRDRALAAGGTEPFGAGPGAALFEGLRRHFEAVR